MTLRYHIRLLLILCTITTYLLTIRASANIQNDATTTRVSVASDGTEANHASAEVSFSADGQKMAFDSFADNLVENDTNESADVFVSRWQEVTRIYRLHLPLLRLRR